MEASWGRAAVVLGVLLSPSGCLPEAPAFFDDTGGTSGTGGAGAAGTSGQGGTGGAGTSGSAGVSGTSGTSGTAGTGGASGTGGVGGSAGAGGTAGAGGVAGTAGSGGSAGTGGTGGLGGTAGTGGTGGIGGTAGTGGTGGVVPTEGPSCAGLPSYCGPTNEMVSCCTRYLVEGNATGATLAGEGFYRDFDQPTGLFDTKVEPAEVNDFHLDAFEVSVGRFKKFLASYDNWHGTGLHPFAGDGHLPNQPNTGWKSIWSDGASGSGGTGGAPAEGTYLPPTMNDVVSLVSACPDHTMPSALFDSSKDKLPMNCVTWVEAFAFCIWDGGRLPSEAEWMYAAAGGAEQRGYPWTTGADLTVDPTYATYNMGDACGGNGCSANEDLTSVGSKPMGRGRWGHYDLGGNVVEYVLDYYVDPYPSNCSNCAATDEPMGNPAPISMKVVRGGRFGGLDLEMRTANRAFRQFFSRDNDLGFRCVYP